jgi:hypothetical protein
MSLGVPGSSGAGSSVNPQANYGNNGTVPVFSATFQRAGNVTPTDGDAVSRFEAPSALATLDLFAYDYTDDTLWARTEPVGNPSGQPVAGHIGLDGAHIPSCWDTVRQNLDSIATWVLGAPGRLYVQAEDDKTIWEVDTTTCATTRTYIHRDFGEPKAENEQMACDAITFGTGSEYAQGKPATSVIWLRDAINQQVVAYAIPDGVCPIPTRTTYLGASPSIQRDQTHFCAKLQRRGTLQPIADRPVVFSIAGDRLGTGTTNGAGVACIDQHVSLSDGVHPVLARFLGDTQYLPSQDTGTFGVSGNTAIPPLFLGGLPGQAAPASGQPPQPAPVSQAEAAQQIEVQTQAQANAQMQAQSQAQAQSNVMSQVQPGMMVQRRTREQVATQTAALGQRQEPLLASRRNATGMGPANTIVAAFLFGLGMMCRRPAVAHARKRGSDRLAERWHS